GDHAHVGPAVAHGSRSGPGRNSGCAHCRKRRDPGRFVDRSQHKHGWEPADGPGVVSYLLRDVGLAVPRRNFLSTCFVDPDSAHFSIAYGSPFTHVGAAATHAVTVRFTPTTTAVASTIISFTADGDTLSSLVTGTGVSTGSLLTVSQAGAGTGTVTSNPAGISCGATCSASFANGTLVSLTAAPAAGSTFTGWSGGCAA